MDLKEPPVPKNNELDELKSRLNEFVRRAEVTQFEGEDIVQLIEEGESVEWIVGQLKANSPAIDAAPLTALLEDIRRIVAPGEKQASDSPSEEQTVDSEILDTDEIDMSQVDLSQIKDMLPPGVTIPPALDANELKGLVESDQGKMMLDFLLFCREKGIEVGEGFLNDPRIGEWQREWSSTPRSSFGGKTPGEMMEDNPGFMPQQVETYRRSEPRVGRNDPCPCGSGKKYKKCCGKG